MGDLYALIGVAPTAAPADITAAYRLMAKHLHPDCGGDAAAFRDLADAYRVLSDPTLRARYDARYGSVDDGLPVVTISASMQRIGCTVRVPVPRWAPCPDCAGRGVRPRRAKRACRDCAGTGSHVESVQTHDYYLPCVSCAATGQASEPCAACSGGGSELVSLDRKVRLRPGARECVYRLDGRPAFRLKVRPLS